jgi:hypothetical protein
MKNIDIDKLVSKVLKENLEEKAEIITRKIFSKEGAFGDGRDKIDIAEPKGKITKADFDKLRKSKKSKTDESEMEEGNEFSNSRCKAICDGEKEFKVGKKSYPLKGVDGEDKKACGCSSIKENKVRFTESELIDLIEKIVMEEKEAVGMAITKKNLKDSKSLNDESLADTTKKMKEYLKDGSKEEYNPNPQHFPMGNGELDKMNKMAYVPSEAVEEYGDAFSYPGMTNLVYDEIKPDDEKIDMYLKGNSKTGNAQKDKDGKDLGNAVSSKVGDKFKKNYDENLYGAEQMNASYKRQAQPVDVAGNIKQKGSLKSIRGGKNSTDKASKILNQLESLDDKKLKLVSEEMEKMKNLIGYNKKTQ